MQEISRNLCDDIARGRTVRVTASDADEAEGVVTDAYVSHRLRVLGSSPDVGMELTGIGLGAVTAGRLTYGTDVAISSETQNVHVNLALRGRAVSSVGRQGTVAADPGTGALYPPGTPVKIAWSAGCVQLCLMVPMDALTAELENLLGRTPRDPLRFDVTVDLRGDLGHAWNPALHLIADELATPSGMSGLSGAARHIEGLVLDGLLLGQPHNYTEQLTESRLGRRDAAQRAAELMQARPEAPWTTSRLASEVYVSVRTLQEGFQRHYGMPPTRYLRELRLRRVREQLEAAVPGTTTVQAVATRFGFLHMGRFTAAYRAAHGELPSQTLNALPTSPRPTV